MGGPAISERVYDTYWDIPPIKKAARHTLDILIGHEAKPNPNPLPATAVTRAFGRMSHHKITRQLTDENPVIVEKALLAAREMLAVQEHLWAALEAGIIMPLIGLTTHETEVMRKLAAEDLGMVGIVDFGCKALLDAGGVEALTALLGDPAEAVVLSTLRALLRCAHHGGVRERLTKLKVPETMVEMAGVSDDTACRLQLRLLRLCLEKRKNGACIDMCLDMKPKNAVDLCRALLGRMVAAGLSPEPGGGPRPGLDLPGEGYVSPDASARGAGEGEGAAEEGAGLAIEVAGTTEQYEHAAAVLQLLCSDERARRQATENGCVPLLVRLMNLPHLHARLAATGAASAVCLLREGKKAFVAAQGCAALRRLLPIAYEPLRLCVLNCIDNVAEDPNGRRELQATTVMMEQIRARSKSVTIENAAADAIRQVRFYNYPHKLKPGRNAAIDEEKVDALLERENAPLLKWMEKRDEVLARSRTGDADTMKT
ncbi:unnamed protein product [Pedinophyceae sp. YPF-701]|nr:unnamed protein product [Pedinophyceae sp. YPF-701]